MSVVVRARTEAGQPRAAFTGEGAYHGSTKARPHAPAAPQVVVDEGRPTTLEGLDEGQEIPTFTAMFPNEVRVVAQLPVPTQREVMADEVTFCWCDFTAAQRQAGPLTAAVLAAMAPHLWGKKRFVYIDSKIQWFDTGDLPVDSRLWHVDGSIAVRDERVRRRGQTILHDLRARQEGRDPPRYLAYQSSWNCATQFLTRPLSLDLPALVPSFDGLDAAVQAKVTPGAVLSQPAGSVVAFDGRTLHRAVPAVAPGWRLWVRCTETDREVRVDASVLDCYGTVFRPDRGA